MAIFHLLGGIWPTGNKGIKKTPKKTIIEEPLEATERNLTIKVCGGISALGPGLIKYKGYI